ncbi:MAG: carbohydrate binding family 9 domain-containing protein, partial [Gemmatimonadetes bacterium]|nr:carbohydrate binding family 9 domain-containing protein [Gemmatimonadota bacterium]
MIEIMGIRFAMLGAMASLGLVAPVSGQTAGGQDRPEAGTPRPTVNAMEAVRVLEPPQIDGILSEQIWRDAPYTDHFIQKEPVEGAPARNDTRVWIAYDDQALYVAAINFDEDPARIARDLVRRDSEYRGRADYFEVLLDPNLDQRTGYRFRTTAGNVQTDRYLFDDGGEDAAWDAVWESAVTVDDRGWIAEFRIPFSQMRYETSDDPQTWGIQIGRRRAADNELTRFSLESKLRPGRVSQFGRLTGLHLIRSPARLELRPFVLSSLQQGPAEAGDPFFDGTDQGGQIGLDMRYGVGT